MPSLFKAKTNEGYTIKILAELLQHNIKTACFEIDNLGIKLRMMDSHRRILIDICLDATNFPIYKCKFSEKKFIGLNLNHFHKMLRSIKKKDSLILFIDESHPNDLGIKVLPKENNRITTSYIKIQNIQNIAIDLPTGYDRPIIVSSSEYQKMCKDMNNIGHTVEITSQEHHIKFLCNAGSVYSREVAFGEIEHDDESDNEEEELNSYSENFSTEQLSRLIKLSGLGSRMKIFPKTDLPLLFKSSVGNLGHIDIYLKSKKDIENDEFKNSSDSDDNKVSL